MLLSSFGTNLNSRLLILEVFELVKKSDDVFDQFKSATAGLVHALGRFKSLQGLLH